MVSLVLLHQSWRATGNDDDEEGEFINEKWTQKKAPLTESVAEVYGQRDAEQNWGVDEEEGGLIG